MSTVGCGDIYNQCLTMLQFLGEYDPESFDADRYEPLTDDDTWETVGVKYVKDGHVCAEYHKSDILFAYICKKHEIK